jgi:hypothetical protein
LAEYSFISKSALFASSRSGEITDLGQGDLWNYRGNRIRNEQLSDFLVSQHIVVDTPERAIACVRMIGSLSGASNRVTCARHNGVKFPDPGVYDEDSMRSENSNPNHWKRTPHREADAWVIKSEYVGPPAQIPFPSTYELAVCPDNRLSDVCQLSLFAQ